MNCWHSASIGSHHDERQSARAWKKADNPAWKITAKRIITPIPGATNRPGPLKHGHAKRKIKPAHIPRKPMAARTPLARCARAGERPGRLEDWRLYSWQSSPLAAQVTSLRTSLSAYGNKERGLMFETYG